MVVFTYSSTFPATKVTFTKDPPMGNYTINRKWMNPQTLSGGGASFEYDKSLVKDIETLKWNIMTVADVASLITFLDVVDRSKQMIHYADVNGTYKNAFVWNSDELETYPTQILREGVTIELFIISAASAITHIALEGGVDSLLTENSYNLTLEF
jgi:hypothetical protein